MNLRDRQLARSVTNVSLSLSSLKSLTFYPFVLLLDTGAVLSPFKDRNFCCPEGTIENSPAFQRWVDCQKVVSPAGTAEVRPCTSFFNRPFGTCVHAGFFPALKRQAIVRLSLRDKSLDVLLDSCPLVFIRGFLEYCLRIPFPLVGRPNPIGEPNRPQASQARLCYPNVFRRLRSQPALAHALQQGSYPGTPGRCRELR
jgi:hypothetical protein